MIRRNIQLAPADEGGGAATETDPETNPRAISGWMKNLGTFGQEAAPPPAPAEKPAVPPATPKPEEAPKPTAPAAGAKPAEAEPEEKWPRTSADWDKFKKNRREKEEKLNAEIIARDARLKELEAKSQEYEAKLNQKPAVDPEQQAELERIRQENKRLDETVRRLNVTEHPKFKEYFGGKLNQQMALAKSIVGPEKAEAVEKLLNMPASDYKKAKIEEFMADLPGVEGIRLGAVLNRLEEINSERDEAVKVELARAEELAAKEAKEGNERGVKNAQMLDRLFTDTLKGLQDPKDGHPAFQKREGDDAWNTAVDQRIAAAKAILNGKGYKPEEIAKAAFEAAAYPAMLENQRRLYQENETLKAQVAALQAAGPKAPAGGAPAAGQENPPTAQPKPGDSFMQVGQHFAKKLQEAWQPPAP